MALDMVAFLNVAGRAGTVALQNVAGMPDAHVTVIANNVMVPAKCNKILGVFAETEATAGSITNQIVLSSPYMMKSALLELSCWNNNGAIVAATQIPDNDAPYNDFKEAPIQLAAGEGLQCLTGVDVAAVAEAPVVLVFLTDGDLGLPTKAPFDGTIRHVYAQAAAAAVINVWSPTAVVFRQALEAGTYALVGMKATGVSMTAARLRFGNQAEMPGVIGTNNAVGSPGDMKDQANGIFRNGRLGVWGYFTHNNPPTVEVLCSVADAAATLSFAFDIIRVGPS